jgi:hypothetical protein
MSQAVSSNSTTAPDSGPLPTTNVNLAFPSLSRRGIIAALAGAAAVNVPAIAATVVALPAATSAAPIAHPDQALLDLGRHYDAAMVTEDAARDTFSAAADAYDAIRPTPPNEMRHRVWDYSKWRFPLSPQIAAISDLDQGDFYLEDEVEKLRARPRTKQVGYILDISTGEKTPATENTPYKEVRQERYLFSVPDPEAQERADEIISAWDRHLEHCEAVAQTVGLWDAEMAYYDAVRARQAIGDEIVAARARTLSGLAVRAGIVAGLLSDDEEDDNDGGHLPTDQKMIAAIVRDLIQITT